MNQPFDLEPLARIFESQYGLMLKTARRFAPDHSIAHDVVQQTFLVFIQGFSEKKWTLDGDVTALLYGITKKVAMYYWTREQKNASEALQMIASRFLQAAEAGGDPIDLHAEREQQQQRLRLLKSCMDKLPTKIRVFLEQHYLEGTTLEDIGRKNDVPPSTVRQIFSRMRARLRDCIDRSQKSHDHERTR